MHIVICLDDKNGMMFNCRRLSSDRAVCARIVNSANGRLWMNAYSAKLFADYEVNIEEAFLRKASAGDTCFAETPDFVNCAESIESLTVYRWNRAYPSDTKLPADFLAGWQLAQTEDFAGYSHETITRELYTR